jgi:hypothetical protein
MKVTVYVRRGEHRRGWKVMGKSDTQDTILPTSCKMNHPS